MHSGQHLVSEYSMAESGSDWTVLLKPEEVMLNNVLANYLCMYVRSYVYCFRP